MSRTTNQTDLPRIRDLDRAAYSTHATAPHRSGRTRSHVLVARLHSGPIYYTSSLRAGSNVREVLDNRGNSGTEDERCRQSKHAAQFLASATA